MVQVKGPLQFIAEADQDDQISTLRLLAIQKVPATKMSLKSSEKIYDHVAERDWVV